MSEPLYMLVPNGLKLIKDRYNLTEDFQGFINYENYGVSKPVRLQEVSEFSNRYVIYDIEGNRLMQGVTKDFFTPITTKIKNLEEFL